MCLSLNNKFNKDILKYLIRKDAKKTKERKKKYHIKNEVFEEVYDTKENELLILMNNLYQKIKEFDDILYTKYRSNNKHIQSNRELLIFEKNIIDFKNCQLQYIKNLINYLEEKNNLAEFYLELKNNNNTKDGFRKTKKIEQYSTTQINEVESQNKDNLFPLLTNNNNNDNKPYLIINKKEKSNKDENTIEKEQINDKPILLNEKEINTELLEKNMNDKISFQEMKRNKAIDEEKSFRFKNKYQVRNNGIKKAMTSQSEMSVLESQKYIENINTLKYLNNENEDNIIKNRKDNNEINGENEENYKFNNSISNKSINNKNNININIDNNNNSINKYHKNYSLKQLINYGKFNSPTESVNYDNQKVYNSLNINVPNYIKNKSNNSSLIDRSFENESRSNIEKEEKKINIRYMQNYRFRKMIKRNKKLDFNKFDFLI